VRGVCRRDADDGWFWIFHVLALVFHVFIRVLCILCVYLCCIFTCGCLSVRVLMHLHVRTYAS